MRIIGFNGPPRSGKDTIAKAIEFLEDDEIRFVEGTSTYAKGYPKPWGHPGRIHFEALIMPCRVAAFSLLGLGTYDHLTYEQVKDMPLSQIGGKTLRRFMIDLSESHLKLEYGRGFYGKSLASRLHQFPYGPTTIYDNDRLLLVTDIGFQEEVDVLSELVGPDNFLLAQITRKGTSFEGDSRGWCHHDNLVKWQNDLTQYDAADVIMSHAHYELGWEF